MEYTKTGAKFDDDKFVKLKKQKIARFYILDTDETKYQQYLDDLLNQTLNDPNIKVEKKVEIVQGAAETAIDNLKVNPTSQASFKLTQNAAKKLRELVQKNPDALKMIFGTNRESEPIIKHSLNVCTLSIKLAQHYKISDNEIDNISTASLMHDVGIASLDEETQELFKKNKSDLTSQERQSYFHHCFNVFKLLREKPYATPEVLDLVENHEENKSGTGPNKKTKLSRSEEILSIVNAYDKRVSIEGLSPAQAMKKMLIDELGNYELKTLQTLQEVLKKEKII
ncbi:MAG: hypothetical protein Fur0010_11220 [Bdellovibrio sp.]